MGYERMWEPGEPGVPVDLRPDVPHPARMYDYYLGGKDHFPADRAAAEKALAANPEFRSTARANRAFLTRAVRCVAALGVDRFLDVGTGIPTAGNTHEIARSVRPGAKVVYVDNDPVVLSHSRALLAGTGLGRTAVLRADLREPAGLLAAVEDAGLLEPGRPVGLVLAAVLHFLRDEDEPYGAVATLLDALPSGSYLVLSHGTADFIPAAVRDRVTGIYDRAAAPLVGRSREEVGAFLEGLEVLDPGVVPVPLWRPEQPPGPGADRVGMYGAVARKP
ncbi:SAM-dependent methyltransferase [Kitasatospora sp. NPDC093558]|uniref:SAM-dependent methyltransferase n=1 Tax=Kitasatospora sp. NPDC093558 TaxID=3155201 RepID=UPI003442B3D6